MPSEMVTELINFASAEKTIIVEGPDFVVYTEVLVEYGVNSL
jgi:uncharacterized protein (DUF4213/DUF364 family)